jgi:hypothetical protein
VDYVNQNDVSQNDVHQDLTVRLAVIEGQPLDERAAAYVGVYDQLREHLEGGDVPRLTIG